MSIDYPRNILNPQDLGMLILPDSIKPISGVTSRLNIAKIEYFEIANTDRYVWLDAELWEYLDTPNWRQLLIIANDIGTYETGLVIMALEKGFNVFFAAHNLGAATLRAQRLRQASAILMTIDDAMAEMKI